MALENIERAGGTSNLSLLLDRQNLSDISTVELDVSEKSIPATATIRLCTDGGAVEKTAGATQAAGDTSESHSGQTRKWIKGLFE